MNKGIFITFEGTDGCGKTTQIEKFASYCENKGIDYILTREPGGTRISEMIRSIILNPDFVEEASTTEALLYASSRAQLVSEVIRPSLENGKIVICDRFLDSSLAYQAYARGLGDDIFRINEFAVQGCYPDLTFFLDLDPKIAQKRQLERGELDRLELEGISFQQKVYDGYKRLAEKYSDRYRVIDADRDPDTISNEITGLFEEYRK